MDETTRFLDLNEDLPVIRDWVKRQTNGVYESIIGDETDSSSAETIRGLSKKIDEKDTAVKNELIGKDTDTSSDLTIKGVSKKIDEKKDAEYLKNPRKIALSGAATGTGTDFDGTKDIEIPVTELDATKLKGTVSDSNLPSNITAHVTDETNPHKVTKAQVGLGNVKDIDQSKAVRTITRDGLTFTMEHLDGTKDTFTQQDTVYDDTVIKGEVAKKANTSDLSKVATSGSYKDLSNIPTKVSEFENDSKFATESQLKEVSDKIPVDTNTTYKLTQDETDKHKISLEGSDGTKLSVTIQDDNTTYDLATSDKDGLMSKDDKAKLNSIEFATDDELKSVLNAES